MTIFMRAACDESGNDPDHDYVVAGGCVAQDDEWAHVVDRWEKVLADYNVSMFHGVDYYNTKGEFRGWSKGEEKYNQFRRELIKILRQSRIHQFAFAVNKDEHKAIKEEMRGIKNFPSNSDYGLAFRILRFYLCDEIHKIEPDSKIAFIVEDGPYSGDIANICHELRKTIGANYMPAKHAEMMESLHILHKGEHRGLEVADFVAGRALKDLEVGKFISQQTRYQFSFLADPTFLRNWHKGMLVEKEKRKNHGVNPAKTTPA